MPLSAYCFDRRVPPLRGLVLGFATVGPDLKGDGMQRLAAAIDAAHHGSRRRRWRAAGRECPSPEIRTEPGAKPT